MDPQLTLDATPLPLGLPHCSLSQYLWLVLQLLLLPRRHGDGCCCLAQVCLGAQVQRWRSERGGASGDLGHSWYQLNPGPGWPFSRSLFKKAGVESLVQLWGRCVHLKDGGWESGSQGGRFICMLSVRVGPLVSGRVCIHQGWCNIIVSDKNTMTGQEGESKKTTCRKSGKTFYI